MANSLRDTDLTPLHAWLIEAGTNDVAAEPLFDGFCGRLVAAGVPIARGVFVYRGAASAAASVMSPPATTNSRVKYMVGIAWRAASATICSIRLLKRKSLPTSSAPVRA